MINDGPQHFRWMWVKWEEFEILAVRYQKREIRTNRGNDFFCGPLEIFPPLFLKIDKLVLSQMCCQRRKKKLDIAECKIVKA